MPAILDDEELDYEGLELPQASEDEILASVCRDSFADFVKEFWHVVVPERLQWNWHMQFLCDELQEVAERVFQGLPKKHDLVINISPGTSKSTLCSVMFPVWCWTRLASCRVISASYAERLAMDLSRKSRDLVKSELFQRCYPDIKIRDDMDAKSFHVNTKGGSRYAIGVDGGVMGQHAHIIVVDDPLDPKAAASDADLENTNRWMEETLPSRKVDKAITPTILIMQRLHQFDPTGMRLSKTKLPVRHICLPAELTDNVSPVECRDFYIDGLMDPVRLGYEVLEEAAAQGEFVLASQYHQCPIPRGGAMFHVDKIKIEKTAPRMKRWVRYWDTAATEGGGAYTVGTLMGLGQDGYYWILDVIRDQWDTGHRDRQIRNTAKDDGMKVVIWIEQEPGGGGKSASDGLVRNLAGYRVRKDKVGKSDGDKEQRADAFSAQVNQGNVRMVKAPWNDEFIEELRYFPRSRYKDQVDSSSGAFNKLAMRVIKIGGVGNSTR